MKEEEIYGKGKRDRNMIKEKMKVEERCKEVRKKYGRRKTTSVKRKKK